MELRVIDLACARAGVPVLEGVSFALPAGQALVLRGPNGIGKTTLLRVVAGLQPALVGRIEAGEAAYAGHADGMKPALSVAENLEFWASVYGAGLGVVAAAMAAMGLGDLADRRAANLSAGQKRRLVLARLLVSGRKLWLLDEPTVSLDQASVALFAGMVTRHLAAGGAALIASHVGLGLTAAEFDLTPFRARQSGGRAGAFDEALG